ncbi:MAG: DUF1801 domain-containing protein [Bacteroidetes bacterium]|nr:DUF1801 domain-containing protein [Bacteroidota bacterium]
MAELKTKKSKSSVSEFLKGIENPQRVKDSKIMLKVMKEATGATAKMWGPAIIGFGDMKLKYASGRELDWFIMGFSPRKEALVLYQLSHVDPKALGTILGKVKTGKGCIYVKSLEEVDTAALTKLLKSSVKTLTKAK